MIKFSNICSGHINREGNYQTVLKNLSFEIPSGEFVTIIGGNGAGKSTLMNTISGEILPSQGKIFFDNLDVTHFNTQKRSKFIGRVFQDPRTGSFPELTIEENLAIAFQRGKKFDLRFALFGQKKKILKEALRTLNLGLENKMFDLMGSLSGGQRQAVSLIMASLCCSKILLLDEHTAALDPKMAKIVLEISNNIIRREKITTFMVTHSMNQALTYGDRTLILEQGKIVEDFNQKQKQGLGPKDLTQLIERNY